MRVRAAGGAAVSRHVRARRRGAVVVALAGLVLALGGCGITLPAPATSSGSDAAGAAPASDAQAPVHNEVPTPPAKAEHAYGAPTPIAAVRAFAHTYINWTAADVAKRMHALSRSSVGQARTELQLEAAETKADKELHSGGVANSGVIKAVSRLGGGGGGTTGKGGGAGSAAAAGGDHYVVVTLEQTTATASSAYDGLAPAWHVAVATVRATDHHRWVVSGWQPES